MSWSEYQVASARRANEQLAMQAQLNSHATIRRELDAIREQLTEVAGLLALIKDILEQGRD